MMDADGVSREDIAAIIIAGRGSGKATSLVESRGTFRFLSAMSAFRA